MGASACQPDDNLNQEVAALPPARYDDSLWMASCRPVSSTGRFSSHTLLFQPDCRVFCPQGPTCKFLHGPNGRAHAELFTHTTSGVFRAAAAQDLANHPKTVVVNDSAANVAVPFVRECWSVQCSDTGAFSKLPPSLAGRTVVVWVHGFRQRFYPVVNIGRHLLHRFSSPLGDKEEKPIFLLFLWPACSRVLQYGASRSNAESASRHLAALLEILKAEQCRSIVIGHSMGCRVALRSLLRAPTCNATEDGVMCSRLILVAAAVPEDALTTGGEFPRGRIAAGKVDVVSSLRDDVLRDSFPRGEAAVGLLSGRLQMPAALGLSGPVAPLPPDVFHLDVSDSLASHSPNMAITCPAVQRCIWEAIGLPHLVPSSSSDTLTADFRSAVSGDDLIDDQSMSLENDEDDGDPEGEVDYSLRADK